MTIFQPLRHGELILKRHIKAGKKLCYRAWTEIEHRKNWFVVPSGWKQIEQKVDVRVGGEEILHGGNENFESRYTARFHMIIPDTRLVCAFDVHVNGEHYSTSLTGVDFGESENQTEVSYVEKIFYLTDDYDEEGRLEGTKKLMDNYVN